MKLLHLVSGLALLASTSGCEKATIESAEARGAGAAKLSADELKMFKHLPAGAAGVFGGNMFEMQRWMEESALGKLTKQVTGPEMTAYNKCLVKVVTQMVGSFQMNDDALSMKVFIAGADIGKMKTCADNAKLKSVVDPDGKYISIALLTAGTSSNAPYFATDGGVYGAVAVAIGGGAAPVNTVTRADLEKDIASLAKSTAADNATLMGLLKNVDRKKQIWFAGSAKGTKIEDKLGNVYGTMQFKTGLAVDISAQMVQAADADKVVSSMVEAKNSMSKLPPNMSALADVVKAVQLVRTKDGVRVSMNLTEAQLNGALEQVGPMMGMMGK
jgi:hypothetical protein